MFRVCGSCKLRILCAHFLSIRKARLRPLIRWAKKRNLETKPGKIIPWVFYMTCNKHCKYFWNSFRKECSSFSTPAIEPSYQWLNYYTTAGETSTCVPTPMPTQELTLLCILCIPNPMNITHLHNLLFLLHWKMSNHTRKLNKTSNSRIKIKMIVLNIYSVYFHLWMLMEQRLQASCSHGLSCHV